MALEAQFDKRWRENLEAWTFTPTQTFGIILMVIAVVIAVVGYVNQHGILTLTNILGDFYANVSSELISIVITVLVLDRLNRSRDAKEREANQKALDEHLDKQELQRLKALMGSNESVVTKIAVAELKANGWLSDGSLVEVDLREANLSDAKLEDANLSGAFLWYANLSGAFLWYANLSEAKLQYANFSGSKLMDANLSGAKLRDATFDKETVLPDGTRLSENVDMGRFTNPEHPDFVQYKTR